MFRGSIPAAMQAIINQVVDGWPVEDIYIGCSGNFTVERVLHTHQRFRLHSNDVTIYSSALGAYLAGQSFRIALKDEHHERFGWLIPYLDTPARIAATVLLAGRLSEGLRSDGTPKDNAYYNRILPAMQRQWPELHAKTVAKLEKQPLSLASYAATDVVPWLKTIPKDAGFVSYPPFFSGDYENMFKKLDVLFEWDKPAYEEIGDGDLDAFLAAMTDRPYWAFGSNRRWPDYEHYLRGMTHTSNRGMPIYVYTSDGPIRIVVPRQRLEPVPVPRLGPDEQIGNRLAIAPITSGQFYTLRSQYMNVHIIPGAESLALAVLVDGVLVGSYAFSVAPNPGQLNSPSTMYLLSDFAVAPTRYRRLSKLVLYAALSRESKLLAERLANKRIRYLFTTAFSQNPTSMKYRGLFDVANRKENPNAVESEADDYYSQRFMINYHAEMGHWSLAEGMELWLKKHASK
jgi:hypothetical protein